LVAVLLIGGGSALLSAQGTAVPELRASRLQAVSAVCADCHQEVVEGFAASTHGRNYTHDSHYANASCESCHGDTAKHVETNEPTDIVRPRLLPAAEVEKICMTCHGENTAQAHWKGSTHQRRGVGCLDCHAIHEPAASDSMVNTAMGTELCYKCHQDKRSEMNKVSHHPVREGKMTCTTCHDQHGSLTQANLRATSVNELCYSCHTEKRGPFLWEHAPVRESCLNCHTPHGSNHLKLQATSVPFLCQQCHSNTRHPGTLYDATRLPTLDDPTTGNNRIFNRACVDCHAAIHGSNHPSAPYLGH